MILPEKMVEMVAPVGKDESEEKSERKEENRKESKEWVSRPRENKLD